MKKILLTDRPTDFKLELRLEKMAVCGAIIIELLKPNMSGTQKMSPSRNCILLMYLSLCMLSMKQDILVVSTSDIVSEIAERRDRMKTYSSIQGCAPTDEVASFRRPRDDGLNIPVCERTGIIVRRDMGSLGVSSFQQGDM
jgi:hypothetical protein